jgi:apolipoprotein N-acyltransferase
VLVLHLGLGALLGLLYAASQRRAPVRGLAAVGVFFGFLLWVISGPILGWLLRAPATRDFRSLAWAVACVTFGVFLSLVTWIVEARRPAGGAAVVPKD